MDILLCGVEIIVFRILFQESEFVYFNNQPKVHYYRFIRM